MAGKPGLRVSTINLTESTPIGALPPGGDPSGGASLPLECRRSNYKGRRSREETISDNFTLAFDQIWIIFALLSHIYTE